MKITLAQRHLFNESKPYVQIDGFKGWIRWDNCDLTDCPPYRLKGSMHAHGKFPTYKYEDLPTTFKDSAGGEHNINDIIAYKSSK
jgi:hypothetical protein